MNLEQVPALPGDIVRDRKSETDYVIESVVGLGIGTSFAIYAIAMYTKRVEMWKYSSIQQLEDQHLLIRKGFGQNPQEVLNLLIRRPTSPY